MTGVQTCALPICVVNATRTNDTTEWAYDDQDIVLRKGDEMGRFLLGSTIIMLFKPDVIAFNDHWEPEQTVRLGEVMGSRAT